MSAGNGSFPSAGQGNWWERANYGGQGQVYAGPQSSAPPAPTGPGGMVTGYPGSTAWFGSQQAQFPNTAPGGTDWLRNMQRLQQYYQQQPGPGAGVYGGGLGYGQQGGLAAPALGQAQGGLYGTGNAGYLSGAPPTGGGTGPPPAAPPAQTGTAPSWLTAMNQQLPAGYTGGGMAQASPEDQTRGLPYNAAPGDTTLRFGQPVAAGTGPDVPWQTTQGRGMSQNAESNAQLLAGQGTATTPGGTAIPPATEPTANVTMQNGRPPTSQVTTAAQLATAPSTTAPEAATANVTIGGGSGATGPGPVRQINDALVKAYYTNKNPGAFWQQAGQILAGGDRQFENYFVQNFDRYMAQYLQAAEKDQNLQLSDWLTGAEGAQIRNDYLMQAPEQRGLDYRRSDPGRFDMRY